MKLNIIAEKKSDLLGRKEFEFNIEFEGSTPKTNDVKSEIAKLTKLEENLIVIKAIKNKYGEEKAIAYAYIYTSLDDLKKLEKYEEPAKETPAEDKAEEKK